MNLRSPNNRPAVALSIGTGSAEERIAEKKGVSQYAQYVVNGWVKRCIDTFESQLDAALL